MSSGITVSPHSRKDSHYQFAGLSANTKHSIDVTFMSGVSVNTMSLGYVDTLGSLRKFLKYGNIAIVYCTVHVHMLQTYIVTYV